MKKFNFFKRNKNQTPCFNNTPPSILPPIEDSHALPNSIEDLKEWHYKALRKINGHAEKVAFSGYIIKEVDMLKFIPIAQKLGLIELSSYTIALNYLKNDTLRQILRNHNLKVSGKKQELIDRILSNIHEVDVKKSEGYSAFYVLTKKGHTLVNDSFMYFQNQRIEFFKKAISLIVDNKFNDAYRMICKRNAEMPVSPGMNCDWRDRYYKGLTDDVYSIYKHLLDISNVKRHAAVAIYEDISGDSFHNIKILYQLSYNKELLDEENLYPNIATEKNFNTYRSLGVDEYMFLATLDLKTCSTCGKLDGQIFKVEDKKIGVNCPPMHKNCRCTTTAIIDRKYINIMERSTRDLSTRKVVKIPLTMNYREWYNKYTKDKELFNKH